MAKINEKVEFVKAHAKNYYESGWDIIIETGGEGGEWSDENIAAYVKTCRTNWAAVRRIEKNVVAPRHAHMQEQIADAAISAGKPAPASTTKTVAKPRAPRKAPAKKATPGRTKPAAKKAS